MTVCWREVTGISTAIVLTVSPPRRCCWLLLCCCCLTTDSSVHSTADCFVQMETNLRKVWSCTITEKASPCSFTFKTLGAFSVVMKLQTLQRVDLALLLCREYNNWRTPALCASAIQHPTNGEWIWTKWIMWTFIIIMVDTSFRCFWETKPFY